MIDLHYWPTPNGWKATIMLEECGLLYRVFPVNILAGEQFNPDFLKIAPNNRIPAIVDHVPVNGGPAVNIFESGAILMYLAEKTGKFLPKDGPVRYAVTQWLMWQMGGVGPMSGQANYFRNRAKDHIEHAITRYTNEVNRLYGVLDRHLEDREFTAGEYSIADIAIYPWVIGHADLGQTLDDFPNLKRWFNTVRMRPAVMRGYAVMEETRRNQKPMDDQTRALYFGQTAATVRAYGSALSLPRMCVNQQESTMQNQVVSRQEWLTARRELLVAEKELNRQRDALTRRRMAMPWERVEKSYRFEGPKGTLTLADLFDGCSQLIVYHFMFNPDWEEGCKSCSFWADNFNGIPIHLNHRDVTFIAVSRAPIGKINAYKERMGWSFPWVSSYGSDFNFDYQVSFTPEQIATGKVEYNYRDRLNPISEEVGISVFYKNENGAVFHTYSCYSRGVDMVNGAYHYLDLVPKGRDEDGLKFTMEWVRRHDQY